MEIKNFFIEQRTDILSIYLREIKKLGGIDPDEEARLAILVKKGDKLALNKLTEVNLKFVVSVAKQYQGCGLELPDLISEGNLGLIKAARRFDETRGFKFISYAVWWIRQSILKAIADQSRVVRLPYYKIVLYERVKKTREKLEQDFCREPSFYEIASSLEIKEKEVRDILSVYGHNVSIDESWYPGESVDPKTLVDFFVEKNNFADKDLMYCSLKEEIRAILFSLEEKERNIVGDFLGLSNDYNLNLEELELKYSITRDRLKRVIKKAIKKMRKRKNKLRDFL